MPTPQPTRLAIYAKDVMSIKDCSDSTATRQLQQLRDAIGKQEHQDLTIKEYCEYFGYDYADTLDFLKLSK